MKIVASLFVAVVVSFSLMPSVYAEKNEITVKKAFWRSTGSGDGPDVTRNVGEICDGAIGTCEVICSNKFFGGDPEHGKKKVCQITYRCEGGGTKTVVGKEEESAKLECK